MEKDNGAMYLGSYLSFAHVKKNNKNTHERDSAEECSWNGGVKSSQHGLISRVKKEAATANSAAGEVG